MGSCMSLACTEEKNPDTMRYERYLTIATSIGNDNPISFSCFAVLNSNQQELLIAQEIARGFQNLSV
jgi:hypothetical protein